MQKNIDNNMHDTFSEMLKKKLETHSMPVDEGVWDAIQKGMAAKKRRRLIPLWWLSAAAVLLLSFIIFGNFNNELSTQVADNKTIEKVVSKPFSEKNKAEIDTEEKNDYSVEPKTTSLKNVVVSSNFYSSKSNNDLIVSPTDTAAHATLVSNIAQVDKVNISDKDVKDSVDKAAIVEDARNILLAKNEDEENKKLNQLLKTETLELNAIEPEWEDPLKAVNDNEWAVLASLGSGRSSSGSSQFMNASNADLYTGLLRAPGIKTAATILSPSDFSTRKFHAPLSFGLRAGKQLNERMSVESGLVYTYLLTNLESPNYSARLNLHYVGVPLNAKINVYANRRWKVYASSGAMVEKGLRSVYVQEQQMGNQIITTSASTQIDGFQWSVSAAVGVAYNFFETFDFYFEPGFSYFFDNDQPLSIRNDYKFTPGVEAGLKFGF